MAIKNRGYRSAQRIYRNLVSMSESSAAGIAVLLEQPKPSRSLTTTASDLSESSKPSTVGTASSSKSSKPSTANTVNPKAAEGEAVDLGGVDTNTADPDRCWVKMDTDTKWADAGDGLFATKDISQGQLILTESPEVEIRLRPGLGLDGEEEDLPDKALFSETILNRDDFLTNMEQTIFSKNPRCLLVRRSQPPSNLDGTEDQELEILLVKPSAVNHSCGPNMLRVDSTNLKTRRLECQFFAIEDIKSGDELTMTYHPKVPELENVSTRRALLMAEFGFFCRCPKCDDESKSRDSQPPLGNSSVSSGLDFGR